MRSIMKILAVATAFAAVPASAAVVGDFRLDGSPANQVAGGFPLVSEGGTIGATGYSFAANQGLVLSNTIPTSVYSIEVAFSFALNSGYRKLIDFKSLTSDAGLYMLGGKLNFYPVATGATIIPANQLMTMVLTRDAGGIVTGYLNGVQELSFTDVSNYATFSDPQQLARFFHDDNATGGGESSAGFVDYIRIYDTALSGDEVAGLTPPGAVGTVPEATTWSMMIVGFGIVGGAMRTRRRATVRA